MLRLRRSPLLSDPSTPIDYAQLAQTELDLAARSPNKEHRRAHLNQAAIFATLDERQRAERAGSERSVG
jgi:hypothetical protein